MSIQQGIARIRAYAASEGLSKGKLAVRAGLRDTVLRHFDKGCWNPTAETLRKLEMAIPADWSPPPASTKPTRFTPPAAAHP